MPEATVAAIVMDSEEKRVLLTQRVNEPFSGYWCLPGGHIDAFETVDDAVVREVEEETGLDFTGEFAFYHDEIMAFRGIHAVVLVYAGTASGTIVLQPEEVTEARWVSVEEALGMRLAFQHGDVLRRYFASIVPER